MDNKDKRIVELEAELAAYKENPASDFYIALVEGVKHITQEIKKKRLDLNEDSFADSIIKLAEKSEKIFTGLEKGIAAFQQKGEEENTARGRKIKELTGTAI